MHNAENYTRQAPKSAISSSIDQTWSAIPASIAGVTRNDWGAGADGRFLPSAISRRDTSDGSPSAAHSPNWPRKAGKFPFGKSQIPKNGVCARQRNALRGSERFKINGDSGKAIHLNQKPLDVTTMIIKASSDRGDVVWGPFGGLFTACIAVRNLGERCHFLGRSVLVLCKQNGYRTGGIVRYGQIRDAVAVEVSHCHEKRICACPKTQGRSEGSISVAQ